MNNEFMFMPSQNNFPKTSFEVQVLIGIPS